MLPVGVYAVVLHGIWMLVSLSQDMVVEFAKMNVFQLLEETEKAVSATVFMVHLCVYRPVDSDLSHVSQPIRLSG